MADDLYAILGVAADADPEQIKSAFWNLARTLHPDAAPTTTAAGAERLAQVLAAWHVLHDPAKRAAYDRTRDRTRTTPQAAAQSAPSPLQQPGGGPDPDDAALAAGPTVIHTRPAPVPGPHIRVGPPMRLGD
jgi:DnaJ-class molecular chaperone